MEGIVKYIDANTEKILTIFRTKTPLELLKTYNYMKNAEVDCVFNDALGEGDEYKEEYSMGFRIKDIEVNMPTKTDAFVIKIYIEE